MKFREIKIKLHCIGSGKADLDGILKLYNDSQFSDDVVAKGTEEFLKAYTIGCAQNGKGLSAVCRNECGGGRRVRIESSDDHGVYFVQANEHAPRSLSESHHFQAICCREITFRSQDAFYTVELGK